MLSVLSLRQLLLICGLDVAQKKSQESINARLALVLKSGKYTLGSKTCLKTLRSGKGMQPIIVL